MRSGFLPQVALIVWVLWITYYLSRATRSLQQRPYTAFRYRKHESRVHLCVRLCVLLLWSSKKSHQCLLRCRTANLIVRLQVCWAQCA